MLKPSRHNFFDLSTLYWVRKGEGLWIFKMTALLFRTVRVIHIELLLCSYCPKEFCPGLQTPLFANSIPHLHISCNTPCLHPPIFFISPEGYSRLKRNWRQCIMHIQNVCRANKVYDGRCANGDWNPVPFVRSSCYCGCGREGSDIKRDRKVFYFITCHWGKKTQVAFRTWQPHFFITFATPMSEKIMINPLLCQ